MSENMNQKGPISGLPVWSSYSILRKGTWWMQEKAANSLLLSQAATGQALPGFQQV